MVTHFKALEMVTQPFVLAGQSRHQQQQTVEAQELSQKFLFRALPDYKTCTHVHGIYRMLCVTRSSRHRCMIPCAISSWRPHTISRQTQPVIQGFQVKGALTLQVSCQSRTHRLAFRQRSHVVQDHDALDPLRNLSTMVQEYHY